MIIVYIIYLIGRRNVASSYTTRAYERCHDKKPTHSSGAFGRVYIEGGPFGKEDCACLP